jgi:ribosomal protein S27AE
MDMKKYEPHVNLQNGDCPHCGANWWIRCIPPRDHRQCGYYLAKQAKREQRERADDALLDSIYGCNKSGRESNAIRCSTVHFEAQKIHFSKVNCPRCFQVDCECGSTPDEDLWDIWWAWYPVRIKPRGWAWLRYVWTRRGERRAMS